MPVPKAKARSRPKSPPPSKPAPYVTIVTPHDGQRVIFLGEIGEGLYLHYFSAKNAKCHGKPHGVAYRQSVVCQDQTHDGKGCCPMCDDEELPHLARKIQFAYYVPALVECPKEKEWVWAVVSIPNASRHNSHFYNRKLTGLRCTITRTGWHRGGCVGLKASGRWEPAAQHRFDVEPVLAARYDGEAAECVKLRYSLPHASTLNLDGQEPATTAAQSPPATEATPVRNPGLGAHFARTSPPPAPAEAPERKPLSAAPPVASVDYVAARFDAPDGDLVELTLAPPAPVTAAAEIAPENPVADAPGSAPAPAGEGGAPPPLAAAPAKPPGVFINRYRRLQAARLMKRPAAAKESGRANYAKEKGDGAAAAIAGKVQVGFAMPGERGAA